jgi:hypothetical protein
MKLFLIITASILTAALVIAGTCYVVHEKNQADEWKKNTLEAINQSREAEGKPPLDSLTNTP